MAENNINFTQDSVRGQFTLLAVFLWVGFPISIFSSFFPILGLISGPLLITSSVFWFILLYRNWAVLQGNGARTTPGKAVGFGFIPFYCFYWWYVACVGLAVDNNRYMDAAGIGRARMSYGLAMTDYILSLLCCTIGLIPVVGNIVLIPAMIVSFIFAIQQKNCVLAILEHNSQRSLK
ncbi:MAG TPA: hypothetical protein DDW84_02155 [Phycisphaerales bacterium]|nr:MAG: hypothetical protein A2Y13_06200 [Planctomycetes bacterium GWC2_45_44]HBG77639.1 hypothetical protein [Phycisphaerales bacterium]HBR20848.1 hypothetical protein [Phycisphaerales bacterium]